MLSREVEGKSTRIIPGTADRLNAAFSVLGIDAKVSQTAKTLVIGGIECRAVRSYTYERVSDFDGKVKDAIRSMLSWADYDLRSQHASHSTLRRELESIAPKDYSLQGKLTAEMMADYIARAQAVVNFWANENVKASFAHNDAINNLFDGKYYEVIMD